MGFLCVIKTLKFRNNWVVAFLEFEEKRIPRKKNLLQSSIRYIIRSLWVCPLIVCMFLIVFISLALFFFLFSSFYRDFRPTTLGKKQEKIRLRLYKTYAWGFAFLITAIAAVIDYLPQSHNLPRPRFGEKTCWFVGKYHFCFSYTMFFVSPSSLHKCIHTRCTTYNLLLIESVCNFCWLGERIACMNENVGCFFQRLSRATQTVLWLKRD